MLKLLTRVIHLRPSILKPHTSTDLLSSKLQLLRKVAAQTQLKLQPSILVQDDQTTIQKLTTQQKQHLALYLPKSPLNPRLSKSKEKEYLPAVTKQLYLQQQEHLHTYLRILQNNLSFHQQGVTLDHYINLIYKDIYARYLISKGVGIEWNAFYADTGAVNPRSTEQYTRQTHNAQNYSIMLDFIQSQSPLIKKDTTIGLYSYKQQKFVDPNNIQVQKTKKMGYYIKQELTSYGKFTQQFQILTQKNSKVYLLIFVQHLQKLIQPNALVIQPGDPFLILKKFTQTEPLQTQYFMLSLQIYNKHQKYFNDQQYQKHSSFDAKYLLGMKAINLPIISQIADYQRMPSVYLVNSNFHLSDFERANAHNILHKSSPITQQGHITINGQSTNLLIHDYTITKQLEQIFIKQGFHFMDLYDVFDDQVYYEREHRNLLKFRTGDKYHIKIPSNASQLILQSLKKQNTIISQSKIVIPKFTPGKKPKQKRGLRKERKEMLSQITQHQSLKQCLEDLSSISISSISPSLYQIYLLMKDERVVAYEEVMTQEELAKLAQEIVEQSTIKRVKSLGYNLIKLYANNTLITGLLYLKNLSKSDQTLNILIQPQSQTQSLIPYALHLNYFINKHKSSRKVISFKNNINLIKLHPTVIEDNKDLNIHALIHGVIKSNHQEQYGMGFQALRLWTAKHDNVLGDRTLNETDISNELIHSQSIRRTLWDLMSLLPQKIPDLTPKLYLSNFMLDLIDCYLTHMDQCYRTMNLHQGYLLTTDFFERIVNQIYIQAVKKRIIAYPNNQENQEHFFIIRRILALTGVIAPLLPFSAYHLSKNNSLSWPPLSNPKFYESLPRHNEMIKTRIKVINKLMLNQLTHAELYCPTLKQDFTERDLQLFFNIDKVTTKQPASHLRQCSLKLSKENCITNDLNLTLYNNEDHCLRCDTQSKQKDHLCSNCVEYLKEHIGEPYKYFPNQI